MKYIAGHLSYTATGSPCREPFMIRILRGWRHHNLRFSAEAGFAHITHIRVLAICIDLCRYEEPTSRLE